jgi:hypothetical protein
MTTPQEEAMPADFVVAGFGQNQERAFAPHRITDTL